MPVSSFRISTNWVHPLLALGLVVVSANSTLAEVKKPTLTNPDPAIQELVAKNASMIDSWLTSALSDDLPPSDRVAAIHRLSGVYFDYLLANSEALVLDKQPEVGHATVATLGGQIAMIPGHEGEGASAFDAYQRDIVQDSLKVLRIALDNPAPSVWGEAATILASRGDAFTLERVQMFVDEGRVEGKKGIGYLSLAPMPVASKYIQKYASTEKVDLRAAAVAQLAYNPDYTTLVRELALNPQTPQQVTASALPGLASTDREFLDYGLALARNKNLNKDLRTQALEYTVRYTIESKTPESAVRTMVPLLVETANELASKKALDAVQDLKSSYDIQ